MKSQVLHTVWCNISAEAAGEIWNWSLLGVKRLNLSSRSWKCADFRIWSFHKKREVLLKSGLISKWSWPRSGRSLVVVTFRVREVFRKTVESDWRCDNLCGSHDWLIDSEEDCCTGCRNVSHSLQSSWRLPSPGRSQQSKRSYCCA